MAERAVYCLAGFLLLAGAARAERDDPTADLNDERDALIDKITKGVDVDASVKRFKELVGERDKVVATSAAAIEHERAEREKKYADIEARRKLRDEYHATADYDVSWRCTLSPDPANPIPSNEGRFEPDWGKVTRKEKTRRPPKNELDEGEPVTMYEVKGVARTYQFAGDRFGHSRKEAFEANVGDLVLVCNGGEDTARDVPAGWGPRVLRSGFAVRIAEPPLIVKKAKWAPIHVNGSFFFWAIKDVKWKLDPSAFILSNIEIAKDLGGGRYEIEADSHREMSWILEVPPSVKVKEPLIPGRSVWAIMGHHGAPSIRQDAEEAGARRRGSRAAIHQGSEVIP
jgi:hypothetical protein